MLSLQQDPSIPLVAPTAVLIEAHRVVAAPVPGVERALKRLTRAHATARCAQPLHVLLRLARSRLHQPIDVIKDPLSALKRADLDPGFREVIGSLDRLPRRRRAL